MASASATIWLLAQVIFFWTLVSRSVCMMGARLESEGSQGGAGDFTDGPGLCIRACCKRWGPCLLAPTAYYFLTCLLHSRSQLAQCTASTPSPELSTRNCSSRSTGGSPLGPFTRVWCLQRGCSQDLDALVGSPPHYPSHSRPELKIAVSGWWGLL